MPPKAKFTKEEITNAAFELTREQGAGALTARALGEKLGSSAKPIFGLFSGMDEVKRSVIEQANKLYGEYLKREMSEGKYPPYKASGMGYIRFAREEKELFKLLFMRDRTNEKIDGNDDTIRPIIEIIMNKLGFDEKTAYSFHLEQWIFVHGIASMIATNYIIWDEDDISLAVTRMYNGLKNEYLTEEKNGEQSN